jgi:histidyl-tRNA synthetase
MINIPKGTKDVLPEESYKWHYIENKVREITETFGYREIRTPVFECTELFLRGVGDTTDIVNKEMYTFLDKGERSMTLKPEGTAGVARSFVENALVNGVQPTKMYYLTPVFRYEKPQAGRLREHHQFGVELYGSYSPYADVEVISLVKEFFNRLGLKEVALNINSIGCPTCRAEYAKALKEYFFSHKAELCPTCLERLDRNPLRVLDCKVEGCKKIAENAPCVLDYLCGECKTHFGKVCDTLKFLGIEFTVNPKIVRGLDYYTGTVFEFVSTAIGSQGTVCGGGRYNNLVEEIGGSGVPAVGFGMGIERLIMVMENAKLSFGEEKKPVLYIAPVGEKQYALAQKITAELRSKNIAAQTDIMEKSLKAQMKYADKCGFEYVAVIGDEEVANNSVILKNMLTKEQRQMSLTELRGGLWQ